MMWSTMEHVCLRSGPRFEKIYFPDLVQMRCHGSSPQALDQVAWPGISPWWHVFNLVVR